MAISDLRTQANQIKNEVNDNQNTAARVGTVLVNIIDQIAADPAFKGIATPSSSPDLTDGKKSLYIAREPGTYTNFGNKTVAPGEIRLLSHNGTSWSSSVLFSQNDLLVDDEPTDRSKNLIESGGVAVVNRKVDANLYKTSYQNTTTGKLRVTNPMYVGKSYKITNKTGYGIPLRTYSDEDTIVEKISDKETELKEDFDLTPTWDGIIEYDMLEVDPGDDERGGMLAFDCEYYADFDDVVEFLSKQTGKTKEEIEALPEKEFDKLAGSFYDDLAEYFMEEAADCAWAEWRGRWNNKVHITGAYKENRRGGWKRIDTYYESLDEDASGKKYYIMNDEGWVYYRGRVYALKGQAKGYDTKEQADKIIRRLSNEWHVEEVDEPLKESNKKWALIVNGEWYSTHNSYYEAEKAQERFYDACSNEEDAQHYYGSCPNIEIREINESLNEDYQEDKARQKAILDRYLKPLEDKLMGQPAECWDDAAWYTYKDMKVTKINLRFGDYAEKDTIQATLDFEGKQLWYQYDNDKHGYDYDNPNRIDEHEKIFRKASSVEKQWSFVDKSLNTFLLDYMKKINEDYKTNIKISFDIDDWDDDVCYVSLDREINGDYACIEFDLSECEPEWESEGDTWVDYGSTSVKYTEAGTWCSGVTDERDIHITYKDMEGNTFTKEEFIKQIGADPIYFEELLHRIIDEVVEQYADGREPEEYDPY